MNRGAGIGTWQSASGLGKVVRRDGLGPSQTTKTLWLLSRRSAVGLPTQRRRNGGLLENRGGKREKERKSLSSNEGETSDRKEMCSKSLAEQKEKKKS